MRNAVKAVIFDFGQTLVDSADGFRQAEKEAQEKLFAGLALSLRDPFLENYRRFRSQFTAAERTVQNASGWYRSRFTGMTEQGARSACAALEERRVTCLVVRPE